MSDRNSIDNLPEEIQIAIKELEEFEKKCVNPNMRMEALNKEMWIRDQIGMINLAKNARIDGYAEGEAVGIEKGKAEGKAEGDRLAKYEFVKKMKARGSDLDFIAEMTGLDLEIIEKL